MAKLGILTSIASIASIASIVAILAIASISSSPADAADACKRTQFKTELVKDACIKGGQKTAKDAMKQFNKDKKIKSCEQRHTKLAPTYELEADGLKQFQDLVHGRTEDAIEILHAARYESDATAQLILGRCLAHVAQFEEALIAFDRAATGEHHLAAIVGRASVLLDLRRADDALAVLDRALPESPNYADAIECRGRALDQLGRSDEAAEEFRRFIALVGASANLRVRSAQLWLMRT